MRHTKTDTRRSVAKREKEIRERTRSSSECVPLVQRDTGEHVPNSDTNIRTLSLPSIPARLSCGEPNVQLTRRSPTPICFIKLN